MMANSVDGRARLTDAEFRLPTTELLECFDTMALIRTYEESAMRLRTGGEIVGPVHPYIGQEAIAVGACRPLRRDDVVVSHYRGHGHAIAKGTDLFALTAELFGRAEGLCGGKAAALVSDPAVNLLLSSGIVGAGVPIAAGAAMAAQVARKPIVVVVFLGEGAFGSGVVHETLNLAVMQKLPLILMCENNGYQGGTRTEEVFPDTSVARLARAHFLPAKEIDGNDVHAVYRTVADAVMRARRGDGPMFIEAKTYLTKFHLQFDRPSSEVRPEPEIRHWTARDPVLTIRRELRAAGVPEGVLAAREKSASAAVESAVERARRAPWPDARQVFTHVWPEAK